MIQRIQSIYLGLAAVCVGAMYLWPFATYYVGEEVVTFNLSGATYNGEPLTEFPYGLVAPALILLMVLTIFMYKNRPVQMRIGRVIYLLLLSMVVLVYMQVNGMVDQLPEPGTVQLDFGPAIFLPVAALVFTFLANRAIKKDDEMVKSVDRLR